MSLEWERLHWCLSHRHPQMTPTVNILGLFTYLLEISRNTYLSVQEVFKAKGKVQEDSNKLFIKPERWQNFSCELNKNHRDEHGFYFLPSFWRGMNCSWKIPYEINFSKHSFRWGIISPLIEMLFKIRHEPKEHVIYKVIGLNTTIMWRV